MKSVQITQAIFWTSMILCGVCRADTVNIDLTSALLSGPPGTVLTFNGTLSNTSASTVFLNSAGINLSGAFTPADEDPTPFFVNAPISLDAGDSTSAIDLFTIDIPDPFTPGLYSGTFTILGGADGNAQDILGSADFTVQVTSAAPEPSMYGLLLASCLALAVVQLARKRSSHNVLSSDDRGRDLHSGGC